MSVFELVEKWNASAKATPTKAKRQSDEVSDEERAQRLAEYKSNAPSDEMLDAMERCALRGDYRVIHRGRGLYSCITRDMPAPANR